MPWVATFSTVRTGSLATSPFCSYDLPKATRELVPHAREGSEASLAFGRGVRLRSAIGGSNLLKDRAAFGTVARGVADGRGYWRGKWKPFAGGCGAFINGCE